MCVLVGTPVPVRVIVAGEPEALLVTVTDPFAPPATLGLKLIETVKVCPGVRVTGVPAPPTPKPAPFALTCEICTLEFPVFVMTTLCEDVPPAFTFPKLRLVLLNESDFVEAMPVPLKARTAGEFGAVLTIDTPPDTAPAKEGWYCTVNVVDVPGFSDSGKLSPLVLKPLPATLTWLIVRTAVPVLLSCTV